MKNNQRGVARFLSAFLQTHLPEKFPREIIFVDNASIPPLILPQEAGGEALNVVLLTCQQQGPGSARNVGISYASGEWILFTDSDCLPTASFFDGYREAMNGSIGYARYVAAEGKDALSRYYESQEIFVPPSDPDQAVRQPMYLITANALIWKQALEHINGFDRVFLHAAGEDVDLGLRLAAIGQLSYASTAVVIHDTGGFFSFVERFVRYGQGNYLLGQLYQVHMLPRFMVAHPLSFISISLACLQFLSLSWGYLTILVRKSAKVLFERIMNIDSKTRKYYH